MAASRRTLRAILERSSRTELAQVLGVNSRAVGRWVNGASIPPEVLELLPRTLRAAKAREKEEKKALRARPEALAVIYGVSVRTAKGWQRKGAVSAKARNVIPLLESEIREPLAKAFLTETKHWERGRLTRSGVAFTAEVNAYLDPAVARSLIEWAASHQDDLGYSKSKRYQLVVSGNAPEAFAVKARPDSRKGVYTAYDTKQYKKRKGRFKRGDFEKVTMSTFASSSREEVLADMAGQFRAADSQGLFIETATWYVRVPL